MFRDELHDALLELGHLEQAAELKAEATLAHLAHGVLVQRLANVLEHECCSAQSQPCPSCAWVAGKIGGVMWSVISRLTSEDPVQLQTLIELLQAGPPMRIVRPSHAR